MGEAIRAAPEEFDLDEAIWTARVERLKSEKAHPAPLPARARNRQIRNRQTLRGWRLSAPRRQARAHAAESKTEAASKRDALIDKRRALMDEWAAFVGLMANAGGEAAGTTVLVEQLGHEARSQIRAG